ncbi:MAG TPA: DUF1232 domain-containing protein [Anaerolineae bacterium]|nr:DUF1232 domain-containing protein [Anaerolineae bacterium]HQI86611.1 DUF1232 domain-containing protein [Anaerolineae bacterium]
MSDEKMQYPERAGDVSTLMGWLKDFFGHFRLAWELLWDGRVPFVTKMVPILTLLYLLSPMDFIPDPALGLGQLDDLAILLIGMRLFIDVCPPALVAEHKQEDAQPAINVVTPAAEQTPSVTWTPPVGQIIDLEAKVVSDAQPLPDSEVIPDKNHKSKGTVPHVW